jgi:glycosyltransferase involved in cell wall biosynthesis
VLTTSTYNRKRLREFHIDGTIVAPGLDDDRFDDPGVERRGEVVLALGRTDPLKDFPLTRAAWEGLPEPRPVLRLFGIEPELADAPGIDYVTAPSDAEVIRLLREATVFVQTSKHEGFCLPILEAMAAGVPVVCTDADGNRDFCEDGVNCLMPGRDPQAVAAAISLLLGDPELRQRLAAAGLETAERYRWSTLAPQIPAFFESLAPVRS